MEYKPVIPTEIVSIAFPFPFPSECGWELKWGIAVL